MDRRSPSNQALSVLCQNVETAVKQVESNYRKLKNIQKAKRFVASQQIVRPVSFSLELWERSRHNKPGLAGFKGGKNMSPRYNCTPPGPMPKKTAVQCPIPSPFTTFKYVRASYASPNLIVRPVATKKPTRPTKRPSTSISRRTTRLAQRAATSTELSGSAAVVSVAHTVSIPTGTLISDQPTRQLEPSKPGKRGRGTRPASAAAAHVTHRQQQHSRESAFQQQFRQISVPVYNHFQIVGIPQLHRTPRTTSPRTRSASVSQVPKRRGNRSSRSRSRSRSSRRKKKKKQNTGNSFMRITVNVTSSSNSTRLRNKNNNTTNQMVDHPQEGDEQFIYRMNSPEFDRTENVFPTNNDDGSPPGSPW
jgi:hypothetical protein